MSEQVWITGMGAVTPAGRGTASLLDALRSGRCCLQPVDELAGLLAGPVGSFDPPRELRRLDRCACLFHVAAAEAWQDAGLHHHGAQPDRTGVIEGSSLATVPAVIAARRTRPGRSRSSQSRASDLVRFMPGAGGAAFAQQVGIEGPVLQLSAGSVSAAYAIGEAFQKIAAGWLDVVVCGGADSPLQPEVIDAFALAGVLAGTAGGGAVPGPFDRRRRGTALGEGGAALVLESVRHAVARGARPRAVLRGFGAATESHSLTAPHPAGGVVSAAVARALDGVAEDISWIKAHATGTLAGDAAECRGLAAIFGERLPLIPLTGLKAMLGHSLGASGAVEAVAAVLALAEGFVPRCVGTEEVDPSLPPCRVATHRERREPAGPALLLSESFGGRCVALVVGSYTTNGP